MSGAVRVSVVMPIYNGAKHLDEAIRSVLNQRGVPFELLLGDDASTDETWSRVQFYRSDPRVRAWRFRIHRGIGGTRNCLQNRARGPYLSICDSDDRMLPGNLKRFSDALDRWPAVGVAYGTRLVLDKRGRIAPERRFSPGTFLPWDLLRMQIPHGGSMIRRTAMEQIGGYREDVPVLEDCDLFLRLAEVTQFRFVSKRPLYLRRSWIGSTSCRYGPKRIQRLVIRILRDTIRRRYGKSFR